MSRHLRSDWKIREKGAANCAVFHLADDKRKGYDEMGLPEGKIKHVEHIDPTAVFDEKGRRASLPYPDRGSRRAKAHALEKAALFALQRMDQMGLSKKDN